MWEDFNKDVLSKSILSDTDPAKLKELADAKISEGYSYTFVASQTDDPMHILLLTMGNEILDYMPRFIRKIEWLMSRNPDAKGMIAHEVDLFLRPLHNNYKQITVHTPNMDRFALLYVILKCSVPNLIILEDLHGN